jgi:hypothetical protein
MAIGLELQKGPLVSALRPYDFRGLFPSNPLMLARYREAFTPSPAKDDPTDAELLLALLLKPRDQLTPLQPQSPALRAREPLVDHRRRLVGDNVRLTSRLTSTLKNDFPLLAVAANRAYFPDVTVGKPCCFLSRFASSIACSVKYALAICSMLKSVK